MPEYKVVLGSKCYRYRTFLVTAKDPNDAENKAYMDEGEELEDEDHEEVQERWLDSIITVRHA